MAFLLLALVALVAAACDPHTGGTDNHPWASTSAEIGRDCGVWLDATSDHGFGLGRSDYALSYSSSFACSNVVVRLGYKNLGGANRVKRWASNAQHPEDRLPVDNAGIFMNSGTMFAPSHTAIRFIQICADFGSQHKCGYTAAS